ncbi:nucleoside-diphosphate-sugar epimerase [Marinobacter santoriniensis NKSG1]|uniref:Nucleoside-diphosphate-sugar epimerase n=1 Tax=Marinobacter santoriniensis NKSG1 TaxID=1288826 RepID=M7D629_9GAMM|nr:NAD(P)H-binding protein [Marinobacter santoriniensis]EMP56183.1 nucleoside-diphosphate-sugar epimerase [Marinobacter santoriniensis NKSG1]
MKVMVLGATGLTGHLVVEGLLAREEIESVTVLVRRPLALEHPRLIQHPVDFDSLGDHSELFAVDALICCLGTTIRKAGSQARFREVDYGYPLAAARIGREQGARALILMSAIGASSSSTIFYNRVKGELEDAVRDLGYPYLSIYHPSLLLGDRQEHRKGEKLGQMAMPLINRVLLGPLDKYRAIKAETVASAMVNEVCALAAGKADQRGNWTREYPDIVALAA